MQSNDVVKTYMVVTGRNGNNQNQTATFTDLKFPDDFVNSTNRRFITVMPPKIIFGDDEREQVDNQYIMHCSFIYRDPWHEKSCMPVNMGRRSKYKKYEYKANYNTFEITFTHNKVSTFFCWYFDMPNDEDELSSEIQEALVNRITENNKNGSKTQQQIQNEANDIWAKIKAHIDEWKNNTNNNLKIDIGTDVTPEREAIVPLFNGFGLGGYRVETNKPPLIKAKKYIAEDIFLYATMLEYNDLFDFIPHESNVIEDGYKQVNKAYGDNFYSYTCTSYVDPTAALLTVIKGEYYKLLEKEQPWSYYAEFMFQY